MSLILDALRRSESERAAGGGVPGIGTAHQPAAGSDNRTYAWQGLLAALVLATLAWWFYSRMPAPVAVPAATPLELAEPLPADHFGAVSTVAPPPSAEPALSESSASQAKIAPINTPHTATTSSTVVADLYRKTGQAELARPVPELAKAAPQAASATDPAPTALDIEAVAELARRELAAEQARSAEVESAVEMLADLAQRFKDQIPTLYYRQHSWSGLASQRFVVINGESRREGDQVAAGVKLVEILPESSVLEFEGTRFRLRALNSWVNL
jgi:general secretion pathway protein B